MASKIAKFYAGRSVFITGGSGFVGKQIVEKLLRSCPEIDNIYLLMRAKKGENVQQRLKKMLDSPVFDMVRVRQPASSRKIVPIVGDVLNDFLGISDADHRRLSSDVSIVIHSAATLSFVEPLRVAVDMNVLGVRRALNVCKQLPHLESMVHISTAYSQVDKMDSLIEEKVYDPPILPERVIALTRLMNDGELEALTPHLLKTHNRPNTYTLTKAIAEKLVEQEHGHVPVCIVRPSIITASQAEPFPGWVDNYVAANGVYVSYGTGSLRCTFSKKPNGASKIDFIPVDRVANNIIVAAWRTAVNRSISADNGVPVYNLVSGDLHTMEIASRLMLGNARQHPYSKLHPARFSLTNYPGVTSNSAIYSFLKDVYVPLRFRLMDLMLVMTGKKPSLLKMYERSAKLIDVLLFFTAHDFSWERSHMMKVYDQLDDIDKKEFSCSLDDMNQETYYKDWWYGLKKYVLKDPACNKELQSPVINESLQPASRSLERP